VPHRCTLCQIALPTNAGAVIRLTCMCAFHKHCLASEWGAQFQKGVKSTISCPKCHATVPPHQSNTKLACAQTAFIQEVRAGTIHYAAPVDHAKQFSSAAASATSTGINGASNSSNGNTDIDSTERGHVAIDLPQQRSTTRKTANGVQESSSLASVLDEQDVLAQRVKSARRQRKKFFSRTRVQCALYARPMIACVITTCVLVGGYMWWSGMSSTIES
jgi:hypothetical protein